MSNINNAFPLCSIILDNYNARCSRWWKNYITNSTGQEIDSLTSLAEYKQIIDKQVIDKQIEYKQIIDKPTHVIYNSMQCITLIFCIL